MKARRNNDECELDQVSFIFLFIVSGFCLRKRKSTAHDATDVDRSQLSEKDRMLKEKEAEVFPFVNTQNNMAFV